MLCQPNSLFGSVFRFHFLLFLSLNLPVNHSGINGTAQHSWYEISDKEHSKYSNNNNNINDGNDGDDNDNMVSTVDD